MSLRNRKAFTLIEVLAALVILGLLYAVSLSVFNATYTGSQQQVMDEQIQIALSAGLRVASLPGNHFSFPSDTLTQMALTAPLNISSGSADGYTLSGDVITGGAPSSNELLVAGYVNGTCTVGMVTSSEAMTWGTAASSSSSCVASSFASSIGAITGTKQNPASLPGL